MLGALKLLGGPWWGEYWGQSLAVSPRHLPHLVLSLPSIAAFPLGITELGVPYIPTARPGSLFIV